MTSLKELKDTVSKSLFGKTRAEALEGGICIDCKEPAIPKCYSKAGKLEFVISGMCEECFDKLIDAIDDYDDYDDDEPAF